MATRIGINGFGRIGRLTLRTLKQFHAGEVEVVIVVGGRNSGTTTRLVELCAKCCPRTHQVETASEVLPAWLEGARSVGVTAGASTPPEEIQAVVERLERLDP
jgi:4-hydroxy-3-methylbut-2-enyl diphosphate reductase